MTRPSFSEPPLIAIIDDEADITTYLGVALGDNGYRVTTTNDPAAALAMLEEEVPDLICLDILMPEQTGLALYTEIVQHPRLAAVPVVILSGLTMNDELMERIWRNSALPAPVSLLEKPVDVDRLLRTIRAILHQPVGVAP